MPRPCAVFISSSDRCPREIGKYLFTDGNVPELFKQEKSEQLERVPFELDNKYYRATIDLSFAHEKNLFDSEFAESVEAVILHFDNNLADGLVKASEWLSFIKEWEPSVQILTCDSCSDTKGNAVTRLQAQEWCIEHGFELVELEPEADEDEDDDEDGPFGSGHGPGRILSALNAHTWSNLALKSEQNGDIPVESTSASACASSENRPDNPVDEGNAKEAECFEDLFQKFSDMKTHCEQMSPNSRKKYAEKITLDFWRAMGGDEGEIGSLSSDDDQ